MLAGGASRALYVGLEVDQTMIFCRRRRAKPTRPQQASARPPGSPAPTVDAGTAKKVVAQAEPVDTAQMCAAKVLLSLFGSRPKPVPLMVNVIEDTVGLPPAPEISLSVKLNKPRPSTFSAELNVMVDEVTAPEPPENVSVAEVTVPDRLMSAAWLSMNKKPGSATNVQVKLDPTPEQPAVKKSA